MLKLSDFDYQLPDELIAQHPAERRDASRLMVIDRKASTIEHKTFSSITGYIGANDLLVLNDTKVIPARLRGQKYGGGAAIEVLLNKQVDERVWEALCRPAKRLSVGGIVEFAKGFYAEVKAKLDDGKVLLYFASVKGFTKDLKEHGEMPLPPYIKEKNDDSRYQTVYAAQEGASAAPTAGLHFTEALLKSISAPKAYVTLHTGYGTFAPVRSDDISKHKIHSESYSLTKEALEAVRSTKARGGKVIAVGTTSARLLESVASPGAGETDLFIYPGYEFKVVDALITNFHLPKTTLLMLVSAFAGVDLIKKAYTEAVEAKYRFFSFGDAMLIK